MHKGKTAASNMAAWVDDFGLLEDLSTYVVSTLDVTK